ncbi:MAG: type II secretion system F family protein [Candidatus Micrarchaeota archaeon]|nr:type II secretion system F family protein [Candidatus Micrarchaeota archaeon]
MAADNMFYEMIGRLFSRQQMRKLGLLLESSGVDYVPEAFAGLMVVFSIFGFVITYSLFSLVPQLRGFLFKMCLMGMESLTTTYPEFVLIVSVLFSLALSLSLIGMIIYVFLLLRADERRRRVEDVLPDFLSLAASNVRAGMTIDQALWYAAKPEFGLLSVEVSIVAKKSFGGVPFNQAIDYLTERFNSKLIRRSVALIKQGLASGGKLADILERTAEDARHMAALRKEISTSLLMYIIFIVFAGAIGTPFLFAVSGKLVGILETAFASAIPTTSAAGGSGAFAGSMITPSKPSISSADFFLFTVLCTIMTTVFSALIIGVISKGSKRDGVPYIPFLLAISLVLFFVISGALDAFLAGITYA